MATGYSKSSPRPRKVVNCVKDEVKAYDAVPNMDPVKDPEKTLAVTALVTNREFKEASDPDTTNLFQLGILIYERFFAAVGYTHLCRVSAHFLLRGRQVRSVINMLRILFFGLSLQQILELFLLFLLLFSHRGVYVLHL